MPEDMRFTAPPVENSEPHIGGIVGAVYGIVHHRNMMKLHEAATDKENSLNYFGHLISDPNNAWMKQELANHAFEMVNTPIEKWKAGKNQKTHHLDVITKEAAENRARDAGGQTQQPQLQPQQQGMTPPPTIPGTPGQQFGEADGAAHQIALHSPGVGAIAAPPQQQQPQQQISPAPSQQPQFSLMPNPAPGAVQQSMMPNPPNGQVQQQNLGEATNMLAETTQMQQGALPAPGPVPQITPSPAQASAAAGQHNYTDLQGAAPVMPDFMVHPHGMSRTPAQMQQQAEYTAEMTSRAQRRSALQETESQDQYKQHQRDTWLARPEVQEAMKGMTPFQRMQFSLPVGMTAPSMAGMTQMMKPVPMGRLIPAASVPDEMRIDKYGNHIDPQKYPHIQGYQDLQTGHMFYEPTEIRAEFTPHEDVTASGGKQFATFAGTKAGDTPTAIPGAVAPSMLGTARSSNTTTDDNGNTSTQSVSRKLTPTVAPAPGAPPQNIAKPGQLGSQPANGAAAGAGGSAVIQQYAEDYAAGKIKLTEIPAKQRNRVLGYMRQNGVQTPDNLSEHGKADMAQLDPVLTQIKDLKGRLEKEGLNSNDNTTALMKDYAMYRLGKDTPHNGLFTNLSFERLRSGAAAMKGTGSRAYQVLSQALDHTPTLDRAGGLLPETTKAIYDKLTEMEHILAEGRGAILQDERRVGTISPPPGSGGSGGGGGVTDLERGPDGKLRIKTK